MKWRSGTGAIRSSSSPVLKLGWTLNFEVYFYVIFALALALGASEGKMATWGMPMPAARA